MKTRVLSMILAIAMLFSLVIPAFAEEVECFAAEEPAAAEPVYEAPSVAAEPVQEIIPPAEEPVQEIVPVTEEPAQEAIPVEEGLAQENTPLEENPGQEADPTSDEPQNEVYPVAVEQPQDSFTKEVFSDEEINAPLPEDDIEEQNDQEANLIVAFGMMDDGVAIDGVNFSDDMFRACIASFDTNPDGYLDGEEIEAVKEIDCRDSAISSLKGIEYFTFLEALFCDNNQLTNLDLEENSRLIHLECSGNYLTYLNVTSCTELRTLVCKNNQLTTLDLRNCGNLRTLVLNLNNLTNLDVSNCPNLEELMFAVDSNNPGITGIDLSNCPNLVRLNLDGNQVTTLDLSHNTALKEFRCGYNHTWSSLDVSYCPDLAILDCRNGSLANLNISNCVKLRYLIGGGNMATLDIRDCPILENTYANGEMATGEYDVTYSNGEENLLSISKNTELLTNATRPVSEKYSVDIQSITATESSATFELIFGAPVPEDGWGYNVGVRFLPVSELPSDFSGGEEWYNSDFRWRAITGIYDSAPEGTVVTVTQPDLLPGTEYFVQAYISVYEDDNGENNYQIYGTLNRFSTESIAGEIPLTEESFPDEAFRNYISNNFDTDADGYLNEEEVFAAKEINIDDSGIATLQGIEHLYRLERLFCSRNQLTNLDLSANTVLGHIECTGNGLTSIDVSNCRELRHLIAGGNQLTAIDVSNCGYLKSLILNGNSGITSIDVRNCPDLETLEFGGSSVSSLDVSNCQKLIRLNCAGNQLTELDLSNNMALETLRCFNMPTLITLDVSNHTALKELDCKDGALTSLNVSGCSSLGTLNVSNNPNLSSLEINLNPALAELRCQGTAIATLDIRNCPILLDAYENGSREVLEDGSVAYEGEHGWFRTDENLIIHTGDELELNVENFPDDAFRNYLRETYDLDGDYALNADEIATVITLTIPQNTVSLEGLQHFASTLGIISYRGDRISELDLSGFEHLWMVSCADSQLAGINLSGCTALTMMSCQRNYQLTELNLSGCTALEMLQCNDNQLTELNLSGCATLGSLVCDKNQLTKLDISECTRLTMLSCTDNHLTSLDLRNCPILVDAVYEGVAEGMMQLRKDKDVELILPGVPIKEKFFPDEAFRGITSEFDTDGDEHLSESEIAAATMIDCSGTAVEDLTGITFFTELTTLNISGCTSLEYLYCSNEKLKTVDASGCIALTDIEFQNLFSTEKTKAYPEEIDISGCTSLTTLPLSGLDELKTLNASGCTALQSFYLKGKQLENANFSGCTALENVMCDENQLRTINLTGCTALTSLMCQKNQLTTLELTDCEALTTIYCQNNQLTELSIGNCASLSQLNCGHNNLTELDVSGCPGLGNLMCSGNPQLGSVKAAAFPISVLSSNPTEKRTDFQFTVPQSGFYQISGSDPVEVLSDGAIRMDDSTEKDNSATVYLSAGNAVTVHAGKLGTEATIVLESGSATLVYSNLRATLEGSDDGENWNRTEALICGQYGRIVLETKNGEKLPAELFTYESSDEAIAKTDENGTIETFDTEGTATISITVKVLGSNNGRIDVTVEVEKPDDEPITLETGEDIIQTEQGYLLSKIYQPEGVIGAEYALKPMNSDLKKGMFKYTVTDAKVAAVKENADGSATVTLKGLGETAITIAPAAKTDARTPVTVTVRVRDYTPRLGGTAVTLNPKLDMEATLPLTAADGSSITDVQLTTTAPVTCEYADGQLVFTATGDSNVADKKAVLTVSVEVVEVKEDGTTETYSYSYTSDGKNFPYLSVTTKGTEPSITVKQTGKINTFYMDSETTLTVTAKNEEIESIELAENPTYEKIGSYGDVITLGIRGDYGTLDTKSVDLEIYLAGYKEPVTKTVAISAERKGPTLTVSPASGTIDPTKGENEIALTIFNKTTGQDIDVGKLAEPYIDGVSFVTAARDEDTNTIRLTLDKSQIGKGGTVKIGIREAADTDRSTGWTTPVEVSYKIAVKEVKAPKLKLGATTLTVSSTFNANEAGTSFGTDVADIPVIGMSAEYTGKDAAEAEKLALWYDPENRMLKAAVLDQSIKTGSYKYNIVADTDYAEGLKATVTVKVADTMPKVSFAKASLTLNASLAGKETAGTQVKLSTKSGYSVVGFSGIDASADLDFDYDVDNATLYVKLKHGTAGKYSWTLTPLVEDDVTGQTEEGKAITLTVTSAAKTASVKAAGKGSIELIARSGSGITYTPTLTNALGTVTGAYLPNESDRALFTLSSDVNEKGTAVAVLRLKDEATVDVKAKYPVTIAFEVDYGAYELPTTVTPTLKQSTAKFGKTAVATVFQGTANPTATYEVTITGPEGAAISNIAMDSKSMAANLKNAIKGITWSADGASATVVVSFKNMATLKSGSTYKIPLIVTPAGSGAITKANVTLSFKVNR